jgi:hypothetical protein
VEKCSSYGNIEQNRCLEFFGLQEEREKRNKKRIYVRQVGE